jgi:hypothetical protein
MLVAFMSADNIERKRAEEAYAGAKANSAWLLQALLEVGTHSANAGAANMAFVLLRRELDKENKSNAFEQCPADAQNNIKQALVSFLGTTQDKMLRKACAAAVSNLATKLSANGANAWPELWELLLGAMNNASAATEVRSTSCYVFGQVATTLATTYFKTNTAALVAAVGCCLQSTDTALQYAAIESYGLLVQSMGSEQLAQMRPLVTPIINIINAVVASGDHDLGKEMIGEVATMTEHQVELFTGLGKELLGSMLIIVKAPTVDIETRHMALETILQFGESKPKELRKNKAFVSDLFNTLFAYIQQPTIDDDWATTYDDDKNKDDTDFDAGTTGMDRLSQIVKGKVIQELATAVIMQNIQSPDWKHRVAALSTLTYIMEGCKKQFETHLDSILTGVVIPRLEDEHPMVKFYAIQCIAQFCADFAPDFQKKHAATVLPLICQKMQDPVPRIVAVAAGTLNTFLDDLEADEDLDELEPEEKKALVSEYEWMQQYVDPLCRGVVAALKVATLDIVQQQCLTTLSSLIQVGGKMMSPFVADLVPLLQGYLAMPDTAATQEDQAKIMMLKCRAIECTTLLACGVGKETYAPWSHAVCEYLGSVLQQGLANDDPRMRFILRGWTCMVECLGAEVLQYLPSVMPRLLAVANTDCDAEVITGDEAEAEEDNDKVKIVRLAIAGEGEKTVRLHTGLIEDKDLAITIVMSITQELKGLIKPYFTDIMNSALKLLEFQSYAEIRDTACETLSALAVAYKEAEPEHSAALVQHCCPLILKAAKEEPETSVCGTMLQAFGHMLKNAPPGSLPEAAVATATNIVFQLFEESLKRIDEINSEKAGLEADAEDEEGDQLDEDADDEDWMLTECVGAVESLIRSTPAFLPAFAATFMPLCSRLLSNPMNNDQHTHALCIYADFIEHAQAAALPQVGVMAPALLHFVACEDEETKQSAVYAAGLLGELLAASFPQPHAESMAFVNSLMTAIGVFVSTPEAQKKEYRAVVDNAVSAVLRCVEGFGQNVDGATLVRAIIPMLPCVEDKIEAERVHERLVKWVAAGHPIFAAHPDLRDAVVTKVRAAKYVTPETAAALQAL